MYTPGTPTENQLTKAKYFWCKHKFRALEFLKIGVYYFEHYITETHWQTTNFYILIFIWNVGIIIIIFLNNALPLPSLQDFPGILYYRCMLVEDLFPETIKNFENI